MPVPPSRKPPRLSSPAMTPSHEPEDLVTGLFHLEGFSDAMKVNSFDQEELVTTLVSHIRNGKARDSIAAVKAFWDIAKDVAAMSGALQTQTAHGAPDGKVSVTQSRTLLVPPRTRLSSGSFAAPAPLGEPARPPIPIRVVPGPRDPKPEAPLGEDPLPGPDA